MVAEPCECADVGTQCASVGCYGFPYGHIKPAPLFGHHISKYTYSSFLFPVPCAECGSFSSKSSIYVLFVINLVHKEHSVLIICIVPCTFQVVPLMFAVIAMLGEKLRQLAKTAQTSVAGISAYLNEVW